MMEETKERATELRSHGWCCAQMILNLVLQDLDRQSPDLVRAARGLCFGLGDNSGPCGTITGACLALGLLVGSETGDPEAQAAADERLRPLLEELMGWFRETMEARHGGITCKDIVGPDKEPPNPEHCGPAMLQTYEKLLEILAAHDIEPAPFA